MQKLRFVNGNGVEIDLTSGNYGITAISGLSNANLNLQTQQVPNNDGSVYIDSLLDNRTIDMTVALNDENDLEKRYQLRRELISALNPKLGEGYLYYKNDFLERRIKVIPNPPVIKNKNSNEKGTVKASVSFTACGVYWEDVEETVVELNSFEEKTVVNNGDVPCAVKVDIQNVNDNFMFKINNTFVNVNNIGSYLFVTLNSNKGEKSLVGKRLNFQPICNIANVFSISYSSKRNEFYIATSGNLFSTKDLLHFETLNVTTSYQSVTYYCDELNRLFLFTSSKLKYSDNNGLNFTEISWEYTTILAMVYGNGKLVAVGTNYSIYVSSDNGLTWTRVQTGDNYLYGKIIYKNGLFIAVGGFGSNAGIISVSSDGINWSTSNYNRVLRDIDFSDDLQLFVAVGDNGYTVYSSDGINWTVNWLTDTESMMCVKYVPWLNSFVASGIKNYFSSDGINWEEKGEGITSISSNRCHISISDNGNILAFEENRELKYSLNCEKYFYFNNLDFSINDSIFSNKLNKFIVVGIKDDLSNAVAISSDGINWEKTTSPGTNPLTNIIECGSYFFVVERIYQNITIYKSSDLNTWESVFSGTGYFSSIATNDNLIIFRLAGAFYVSSDYGQTWEITSTENTINSICYSESKQVFIAAGSNGIILSSVDGINWEEEISPTSNNIEKVKECNNNIFVITENYVYVSDDFDNWSVLEFSINTSVDDLIFYSKNSSYLFCTNSGIYVSFDLQNVVFAQHYRLNIFVQNTEKLLGIYLEMVSEINFLDFNVIDKALNDSNFNLQLENEENKVFLQKCLSTTIARLTYRQKYLGV
jgi:photosystem II stability/assembly factor-like uncharacterized protein